MAVPVPKIGKGSARLFVKCGDLGELPFLIRREASMSPIGFRTRGDHGFNVCTITRDVPHEGSAGLQWEMG